MDFSPAQMVSMILDYIRDLELAQNALEEALHDEARAERDYRKARAAAWRNADGRSAGERDDIVNSITAEDRLRRDAATADAKTQMERVRSKRQSLSALQSAANSIKEESAHSRVGPDMTGMEPDLASQVEKEAYRRR